MPAWVRRSNVAARAGWAKKFMPPDCEKADAFSIGMKPGFAFPAKLLNTIATKKMRAAKSIDAAPAEAGCIVRSVASAFAAEPKLEAVTINKARQTISVATLGRVDDAELTTRITETVQQAQSAAELGGCGLLEGTSDCASCATPP